MNAMTTRLYCIVILFLSIIFSNPCHAQQTINIRYSGENNMNQALSPRRQGLAVMAALEAKGDQAALKAQPESLEASCLQSFCS